MNALGFWLRFAFAAVVSFIEISLDAGRRVVGDAKTVTAPDLHDVEEDGDE